MRVHAAPLVALLGLLAVAGCTSPAHGTASPPPGPAPAADFRSARLEAALDAAGRLLHARGYPAEGAESRGFVVEHGTHVVAAPLEAGSCYVVLAVGSHGIASLDLALYDPEGEKVAAPDASAEPGANAGLRFCPPRSSGYWAVARAAEGSGLVALRRFRGPSGLDVRLDDLLRDPRGAP